MGLWVILGRGHLFGGVVGYQALVCRRLEGLVEGGVDTVDGGGREAGTLAGARGDPATLLERVVEFSQIHCRDLGEFLVPR